MKLWEAATGKFITTLRGHVQAVYTVAWSADSRLLLSSSADSTLKGIFSFSYTFNLLKQALLALNKDLNVSVIF